jgi:2-hydroxycyclohexanecarboxyl-CoA dehydrogenase
VGYRQHSAQVHGQQPVPEILVAVGDDFAASEQLADELGGVAAYMDVVSTDSVKDGFAAVTKALGPVEILVNNAGFDEFGR